MPEVTTAIEAPAAPAAASKPTTEPIQDAYADLDTMVEIGEKNAEKEIQQDSEKTASKTKPDKAPVDKKESDKSQEAAKQAGKKPSPAAELRTAYEALKLKHRQLEAEHQALKTAKPPEDPEKKLLSDRLSEREKRLSDLENEIKFAKYESSSEYKQKYEEPFIEAYQTGRAKTATFKITDSEGNQRQATPEDFDRIARISDDDQAAEIAAEMFGNKAPVVLYHRERVQELNGARIKAIEDFRKQGTERERQWNEQTSKQREAIGKLWKQVNEEALEKYPRWFKSTEGDEEGNRLLEDGFKMADAAFSDNGKMTVEQRVKLHSAIRNRAAGFARLAYQNKQLMAKVKELEDSLKEFKSSEPKEGEGGGKKANNTEVTIDSVVDGLDALAR